MRIKYFARRYWPAVGGVEAYLREVCREIARSHDLTVYAQRIDDGPTARLDDSLIPPPSFESFVDDGVRVMPLRLAPARRVLLAPLLAHVTPGLRRFAYGPTRSAAAALYGAVVGPHIARTMLQDTDLVHMWGHDLLAVGVQVAAEASGLPFVVTPFAHMGQWGDDRGSRLVYRRAAGVIALLDVESDFYRALGVPPSRLHVSGICTAGVAPGGGGELRRRHQIAGPLVLYLGVRRPYKGFDVLVDACRILSAHNSPVTVAFVGPGPRVAVDPSIRVVDVGAVTPPEKAAWLDAADLLCLPSAGEIFPVSIAEAWSAGTPVLVSDLVTLAELMEKSGGGQTVPRDAASVAAAIESLLAHPRRLAELGERGRQYWREHLRPEVSAAWHNTLYESLR